jgi:hypothetical protein
MQTVKLVNTIFGFQTMLCVGVVFTFTLFTLFVNFKAIYYQDLGIKNVAASSLYWSLFYNIFKVAVVATCNSVDAENATLSTLIYKLMNRDILPTELMEAFGYQVQQISGKSSCGLFNFDYSLIMMVGPLTSHELYRQICFLTDDLIDVNLFHYSNAV